MVYSKFGFAYTELMLNKEEYLLIKEDEVIGVMPRSGQKLGLRIGTECLMFRSNSR